MVTAQQCICHVAQMALVISQTDLMQKQRVITLNANYVILCCWGCLNQNNNKTL